MSRDYNNVSMICRTTKDMELKYLPSGTPVTSFSVANNNQYTVNGEKKEEVSFFEVVSFGKQAEVLCEYLKKGHRIFISGRLKQRAWTDQDGNKRRKTEITLESFQFLNDKKTDGNSGDSGSGSQAGGPGIDSMGAGTDDHEYETYPLTDEDAF